MLAGLRPPIHRYRKLRAVPSSARARSTPAAIPDPPECCPQARFARINFSGNADPQYIVTAAGRMISVWKAQLSFLWARFSSSSANQVPYALMDSGHVRLENTGGHLCGDMNPRKG